MARPARRQYHGVDSVFSSDGPAIVGTPNPLALDGPGGTQILSDILKQKSKAGVDVRVLGWVSFAVMDSNIALKSGAGSIGRVCAMTMDAVNDLRSEPTLAQKVMLSIIGHTAGAVHNKFVVIGNDTDAVAFTGGIDFQEARWAHPGHPAGEAWHDIMAQVNGPAVQSIYHHFGLQWTENLSRPAKSFRLAGAKVPSRAPGTPALPIRQLTLAPTGTRHHVQCVRTVPQFNYKYFNCLPENPPIAFAPQGSFQYKLAWRKAMSAAQTYILIEDQTFSGQEILGYANTAIKNNPDVRVVLIMSGADDPVDGPQNIADQLTQSINHGLLQDLDAGQIDRVRAFRAFGDDVASLQVINVADEGATALLTLTEVASDDTSAADAVPHNILEPQSEPGRLLTLVGNPVIAAGTPIVVAGRQGRRRPADGAYGLYHDPAGLFVHAKTVLVDDQWAVIGSGNCMRRSLYTDLEHGVAFIDEDGTAVPRLPGRADGRPLRPRHRPPTSTTSRRRSTPGIRAGARQAARRRCRASGCSALALPVTEVAFTDARRKHYDTYDDTDSRDDWGGLMSVTTATDPRRERLHQRRGGARRPLAVRAAAAARRHHPAAAVGLRAAGQRRRRRGGGQCRAAVRHRDACSRSPAWTRSRIAIAATDGGTMLDIEVTVLPELVDHAAQDPGRAAPQRRPAQAGHQATGRRARRSAAVGGRHRPSTTSTSGWPR